MKNLSNINANELYYELHDSQSAGKVPDNSPKILENAVKISESMKSMPENAQEKQIYKYVQENGSVTTAKAMELLGVKQRRARVVLSNMVKSGYLKKKGAARSTIYIIE